MKFKELKIGDTLWSNKQPGMFLVLITAQSGALVINLMGQKTDPMPVGWILPRDSEDWILDDKNAKLTDEEKDILEQKLLLFEMMNN